MGGEERIVRLSAGGSLLLLVLGCIGISATANATVPAPAWFSTYSFSSQVPGIPAASAVLADGTTMVVGSGVAKRYDSSLDVVASVALPGICRGEKYAIDPLGSVIVESETNDSRVTAMKCDGLTGRAIWTQPAVIGVRGFEPSRNEPLPIVIDPTGDVFFGAKLQQGTVNVTNETGAYVVARLDGATGALRWPAVSIPVAIEDKTSGFLAVDGNGDLFVTGFSITDFFPPYPPQRSFIAKISGSTGQLLWGPMFDDDATGRPSALAVDGSGDLLWLTERRLMRLEGGTGRRIWERAPLHRGAAFLMPDTMSLSASGELFAAGWDGGARSIALVNPRDGSIVFGPVPFDAAGQDTVTGLTFDSLGNVLATSSLSSSPKALFDLDHRSGITRWSLSLAGPPFPLPPPLVTKDGNLFALLPTTGDPSIGRHPVSIDPGTGNAVFEGPVFDPPNVAFSVSLLAGLFEANGDPLTISNSFSLDLRRFDHSTGATTWSKSLDNEWASSPVLDAAGDVSMAIADRTALFSGDIAVPWSVEKRSGSDGSSLWSVVFDSNVARTGRPVVGADGSNNVVVAGFLDSNVWKTSKVDAADGHVIWSVTTANGSPLLTIPATISTLPNGNVVVAGTFGRITCFSGSDGSVVWSTNLDTGSSPFFLAMDDNGDIGVLAELNNVGVTKLSGSDGAILWGPVPIPSVFTPSRLLKGPENDWIAVGAAFVNPFSTWGAARLSSSDGSFVWGPIYGPSTADSQVNDAAFDSDGDLLILGCLSESWGGCRATVQGLDSATGSDLWGTLTVDGFGPESADQADTAGPAPGGFIVLGHSTTRRWTTLFGNGLSIEQKDLLPAICGIEFEQTLNVLNATGTPAWTVVSGALPDGVTLSSDGVVSGTPLEEGTFPVTIEVQSGAETTLADYALNVFVPGPYVTIQASASPVCPGTAVTLSVIGTYDSYQWLPGGETTPTVEVTPGAPTVYGVIVGLGGCHQQGSTLVETGFGAAPAISAPASAPPQTAGLVASTPDTGASYSWSIENGTLSSEPTGAQVTFGSGAPGTVIRLTLDASRGDACTSDPSRFFVPVDFLDLPSGAPFHDYVDAIEKGGVTNGCGNGNFCPNSLISREQMAAFVARAIVGVPPVTGKVGFFSYNCSPGGQSAFADVLPKDLFCSSIHYIASRKITLGCTAPPQGGLPKFCPLAAVTREQMALFIGRAIAPGAVPPSAYSDGGTGRSYDCSVAAPFSDVVANTETCNAVGYIWAKGVVDGFGDGSFHPNDALTRAPAAKFIANAFGLTLGP